jgi:glutathione peroxidase-family protein
MGNYVLKKWFSKGKENVNSSKRSFFDLEAHDINDELVKFKELKEKKLILIVNVASQCGLTKKNYTNLNTLYDKFEDQGKPSLN